MHMRLLFAAAAAAAVAVPALAQPPAGHDPFKMLDADGNGQVSLAEFRAHAAQMFGKIDSDGDGRATLADFRAAHEKMRAEHAKQGGPGAPPHAGARGAHRGPPPGGHHGPPPPEALDADRDGVVTLVEFTAGLEQHFGQVDANRDGIVTREEMAAMHVRGHPTR